MPAFAGLVNTSISHLEASPALTPGIEETSPPTPEFVFVDDPVFAFVGDPPPLCPPPFIVPELDSVVPDALEEAVVVSAPESVVK